MPVRSHLSLPRSPDSIPGWRKPAAAAVLASFTVLAMLAPIRESGAREAIPTTKESAASPVNGYAEQLRSRAGRPGSTPARLYAPIKQPTDEGEVAEIEMFVGESRVFPTPGVGRIAVGNGSILTAAALDNKEVILFANGVGTSSLFVWNEDGRYQRLKINIVPGDTSRYAREIAAFLTTIPNAKASIIGDKVIVEGDELSDSDLSRIDLLAMRYPQIVNFTNRLGFEQMVMMDVKVVEFPVTELRELGLKWGAVGGAAIGGIWSPAGRGHAGPYQINIRTGEDNSIPILNGDEASRAMPLPRGLNVLSAINLGLNATLNALAQEGKTTILAEPQLSARNGSKASFLAGGEIPYAVSTLLGTNVQFKPYGVKLEILPRVNRNGVIRATIETEFSQIDSSVSTSGGPALLTRKTNTEFNVRNGETIVLSGLLQRESATNIDKVPFLGEVPVLGALFRSRKFQNKETELVIFVTPTVVDSRSPGVVDRVQKTNERLQDRLGPPPYLTDPLQPGADPSRLDSKQPPAPGPAPRVDAGEAAGSSGAVAQPVSVSAARSITPDSTRTGLHYTVLLDRLALRLTPDINAPVLRNLNIGQRVSGLAVAPRGAWTAVEAQGQRGWVAAQWLQPVAGETAATTEAR